MHSIKFIVTTASIITSHIAMAESTPRSVDLGNLYGLYQKSGYSSLELMEPQKRMLIKGVVREISKSFTNTSILSVGTSVNSKEVARLAAANEAEEQKLSSLKVGDKFQAACDLAFTSGSKYMSFQECVFK